MARRKKVTWSEIRYKTSFNPDRIYAHYYRVRLECGHFTNARAVKGGVCPATVTCEVCW